MDRPTVAMLQCARLVGELTPEHGGRRGEDRDNPGEEFRKGSRGGEEQGPRSQVRFTTKRAPQPLVAFHPNGATPTPSPASTRATRSDAFLSSSRTLADLDDGPGRDDDHEVGEADASVVARGAGAERANERAKERERGEGA